MITQRPASIILSAIVVAASAVPGVAQHEQLAASIDAIAEEAIRRGPIAGLSIAVVRGEETLLAKGYGYADLENGVETASATVFRIGSVTKQFTAAAIMRLVEGGEINLDDELTKFLPDYPTQGYRVTVRHLLNHTSGIKSYTSLPVFREQMRTDLTHDELTDVFANEPFDFKPGDRFLYNNSGYYLLGMIVEQVSGRAYVDYLQEELFSPLGLQDTHYDTPEKLISNRSQGYSRSRGGFVNAPYLSMALPFSAGALASTVVDLARWQRALFSERVVSRASLELMTTPASLNDGSPMNYGFGLVAGELQGHRKISHGGSINGFRSALAYYPDSDLVIAVLANTDGANPSQVEQRIARLVLGPSEPNFDIVIRGGTVIDGTGAQRFRADIGIQGGVVVQVGQIPDSGGGRTLDARGLIVAPGFIDVHNHTAPAIARRDRRFNEGFVRQGVTTVVGGPDGGMAPQQITRLIETYGENGTGTNVAFYVGHNAIRRQVMGEDQRRPPTDDELESMKALVREGMQLGAVGLSTGLMYEPGMYSDTAEVIALAMVVEPFNGTYDSHVRNPVHDLLGSDREVIQIGEAARIPAKIGHLKAVGLQNEGLIHQVIRMVEEARARGLNVVSDQYPYDGAQTSTLRGILVVPEELRGTDVKTALSDRDQRELIQRASENGVDGGFAWLKATGYSSMRIVNSDDYPELVGQYLSELADLQNRDPFDVVAQLILDASSAVTITLGAIREADVQALLLQPWNMIASDGAYVDSSTRSNRGHPRSTGTFPRVLGHYVREQQLLSLEEAVRRMSSLPATFVGLGNRGRITEGAPADIVVFDADSIADRSTWLEPNRMAEGVHHLLVNGVPVLLNSQLTGEAPGRYLPRQSSRDQ